ncbi:MAG TPA: hypothetical protein PLS63_00530 [Microthrixaceae bacterium]|nr:hypothetical protein [Microthrixaceae bacterium]
MEATHGGTSLVDTSPKAGRRLGALTILALMALTALVGGLRFARADVAGTSFFASDNYYTYTTDDGHHLEHLNIDIVSYLSMIEQRRGDEHAPYKMVPYPSFVESGDVLMGPVAPFIHRPALPFVASLLPFDAADSFALVNLALVVAGTFFMIDALAVQGRSRNAQLIGALIYAVSLPLLVFTSSLYIDGGAMAVFVFGYWLIARRCWWALALFIPISYLVKEALVFLVPSVIVAWKSSGRSFKDARFLIGAPLVAIAWVAVAALVRLGAPDPTFSFSLGPKLSYLGGNLGNVKSAAFFALGTATVMVPAFVQAYRMVRSGGLAGAFGRAGVELTGLAMFVLVNLYSMVSTDLTLRTAWLFWPFAISLTALLVDELRSTGTPWTRALAEFPA